MLKYHYRFEIMIEVDTLNYNLGRHLFYWFRLSVWKWCDDHRTRCRMKDEAHATHLWWKASLYEGYGDSLVYLFHLRMVIHLLLFFIFQTKIPNCIKKETHKKKRKWTRTWMRATYISFSQKAKKKLIWILCFRFENIF